MRKGHLYDTHTSTRWSCATRCSRRRRHDRGARRRVHLYQIADLRARHIGTLPARRRVGGARRARRRRCGDRHRDAGIVFGC